MKLPIVQKEIKGILYVVATPIGNLSDITLRALSVLSTVEVIAAEHVQTAHKLLSRHGIMTRVIPVHQHNENSAIDKIISFLNNNQSVALITDAGTPAISDPGAKLVRGVREQGFNVVPIPGANAAISALSRLSCSGALFLRGGDYRTTRLQSLSAAPISLSQAG